MLTVMRHCERFGGHCPFPTMLQFSSQRAYFKTSCKNTAQQICGLAVCFQSDTTLHFAQAGIWCVMEKTWYVWPNPWGWGGGVGARVVVLGLRGFSPGRQDHVLSLERCHEVVPGSHLFNAAVKQGFLPVVHVSLRNNPCSKLGLRQANIYRNVLDPYCTQPSYTYIWQTSIPCQSESTWQNLVALTM
jgi:hypothetical protein